MTNKAQTVFRAEALQKLRSPEQLDNAFRLTPPIAWVSLVILATALVATIVWGFVGRLHDQVNGMGVIVHKNASVYVIGATAMGRVTGITVTTGQQVKAGDAIATLALPDQEVQRSGSMKMLADLTRQREHMASTSIQELDARRTVLNSRISALQEKINADRQRSDYLRKMITEETEALRQGYVRRDELESTRAQLFATEQSVRDAQNAISSAKTEEMNYEHAQARQLTQLEQQILSEQNRLDSLQTSIDTMKVVYTPVDGTVAEVSTKLGAVVTTGEQLVSVEQTGSDLQALAYIPLTKGKLVKPGMPAVIALTSVESSIYGSVRGVVAEVSTMSVTSKLVANELGEGGVAQKMMEGGPAIQVVLDLPRDPSTQSGLSWTSSHGPPMQITTGTTATVAITVKSDRPIDLVVPIYETWIDGH